MDAGRKPFSHVADFTGYMEVVARYFASQRTGRRVLELPAGNGLLADALCAMGNEVVCGDINRARPEYRCVDLARTLPFTDGEFDATVCLEGLEHLVDPVRLIGELVRVTRSGGEIVISTPNVMNFYSRLQFLFTGVPYQFNPAAVPEIEPRATADRGHVFPLSYFQLRYLFAQHGVGVKLVLGDRYKRKALMPLYLLLLPLGWLWARWMFFREGDVSQRVRNREMFGHAHSAPLLFSRSLVLVFEKQ